MSDWIGGSICKASHQERDNGVRSSVQPLSSPPLGACHCLGLPLVFSPAQAAEGGRSHLLSSPSLFANLFSCKQILLCGIVAVMGKRFIYFQFCTVGRLLRDLSVFSSILICFLPQLQISSAHKCGPFYLRVGGRQEIICRLLHFQMGQG